MNFKVVLGIWGAADKDDAQQKVADMLNAYDLHNFSEVEINWLKGADADVKKL